MADATGVSYRPALKFDFLIDIIRAGGIIYFDKNGLKVKLGRYLQDVPSANEEKLICKKYEEGQYTKSGNQFTISQRNWSSFSPHSRLHKKPMTKADEYIIGKDKYARVDANFVYPENIFTLSNGKKCVADESKFVKVQPIVWRLLLKHKIMLAERILIPGIPINEINDYLTNFFIKEIGVENPDRLKGTLKLPSSTIQKKTIHSFRPI